MTSDLHIARQATPQPIEAIASALGLAPADWVPMGRDKAKILRPPGEARGKLVLVSAMTPTPAGEGKTTTSVGLADGLHALGERVCVALREPSLGPTLGMKGGAAGGGYAQVIPMEDINLHFTGDLHAVTTAHNLLASLVDHHLQMGNATGLEARTVRWKRVMDLGDRALRHVIVGLGGRSHGVPRETGFDITAASEVMAILCMATSDADLTRRLQRIIVGRRRPGGAAVTADDLKAAGAMHALLRDAMYPNLVQTLEGTPALIHGGPFANIAQGTNTILATTTAMSLADWTVTEAGFGFDLGGEKFLDLKCTTAGIAPDAVVMVATVRALKFHGGVPRPALSEPNVGAVEEGLSNLAHHVKVAQSMGLPVVVAVNVFGSDTAEEVQTVLDAAKRWGVRAAPCTAHGEGGQGATDLAREVMAAAATRTAPFTPIQTLGAPVKDNVHAVATRVYGAAEVVYTAEAERDLKAIHDLGLGTLPVCIAKTPASLTDNPRRKGAPTGHTLHVRQVEYSAGAGFVVPITGDVMRMPGMPKEPAATRIYLNDEGQIEGLM